VSNNEFRSYSGMPLQGQPTLHPRREAEGLVSTPLEPADARNLKRLLHPGAETKDVIAQYVSTIRCLRILDPLGVLLHNIADPIRRHLRDRSDTIRCIVATLVEGEELQDENEASGLISQSNDGAVENFLDPKWEPEPIDAAPGELVR